MQSPGDELLTNPMRVSNLWMEEVTMKRREVMTLLGSAAVGALTLQAQNGMAAGSPATRLDVIAMMKVRPGRLEGFRLQAAECIRQTKQKDKGTLRYDWFMASDGITVEILEAYESSDAWIQHRVNIGAALDKLFSEFADDHRVNVFGEPSQKLRDMANASMKDRVKWFSFMEGIGTI
jgi:quinol monooxygenase YgiN